MPSKLTTEEFQERINKAFPDDNYEVLSDYTGNRDKIKIRHNCATCNNHEDWYYPYRFIKKGCKQCGIIGQHLRLRKTTEQFKQQIYEKYGDAFTVLGEYVSDRTPIQIQHNCKRCNNYRDEYIPNAILSSAKVKYNNFCKAQVCQDDRRNKTDAKGLTPEEKVKIACGTEFEFIEFCDYYSKTGKKYKGIKLIHLTDEPHEFITGYDSFLGYKKCNKCCIYSTPFVTLEDYLERLKEKYGDEYELIGEFKGISEKALFRHHCDLCNNSTFEMVPRALVDSHDQRCPNCAVITTTNTIKNDFEYIKNEINRLDENYILADDNYVNGWSTINIKHLKCGNTYPSTWNRFQGGGRCPYCYESKGENSCKKTLDKLHVNYKTQYTNKTLINPKTNMPLKVDFGILDSNNNLIGLIEYDGELHYKAVDLFGGVEGLNAQQYRDSLKDAWAITNDIPLLRIPYWEFDNIEQKITDFIANLKLK